MFDITEMIKRYRKCTTWRSFDVETTGLSPYLGDRIFSFCWGESVGGCHVVRIDKPVHVSIPSNTLISCIMEGISPLKYITNHKTTVQDNMCIFRGIFDVSTSSSKNISLIIHNCKFEKGFCAVHDIRWSDDLSIHDTMLMSRLLDNQSPSHELDKIVDRLGGDPFEMMSRCDKKIKEENIRLGGYQFIDVDLMTEYQLYDAIRPLLIQEVYYPEIIKKEKMFEDYCWEVQTALDTQEFEEEGITVHKENCDKLISWLNDEIQNMQHDCFRILGRYINLDADKQVADVLFSDHGLGFKPVSFTEKGVAQTDKDVIFKLQEESDHPFLDLLLRWRSYTDGRANVTSYMKLVDKAGKIHTTLNTCQARTHRQSSSNPNLQNVSKESALKNPYAVPARKCFCCGD